MTGQSKYPALLFKCLILNVELKRGLKTEIHSEVKLNKEKMDCAQMLQCYNFNNKLCFIDENDHLMKKHFF